MRYKNPLNISHVALIRTHRQTLHVEIILFHAVAQKVTRDSLDFSFYTYFHAAEINVTSSNANATGDTECSQTVTIIPTLTNLQFAVVYHFFL